MQAQRRATESCLHAACLEVPGAAPHQGPAARAAAHIAPRASDAHKQGRSAPPGEPQGRGQGWQAHGIPTLLTGRAKPTNPHSHSFPPLNAAAKPQPHQQPGATPHPDSPIPTHRDAKFHLFRLKRVIWAPISSSSGQPPSPTLPPFNEFLLRAAARPRAARAGDGAEGVQSPRAGPRVLRSHQLFLLHPLL